MVSPFDDQQTAELLGVVVNNVLPMEDAVVLAPAFGGAQRWDLSAHFSLVEDGPDALEKLLGLLEDCPAIRAKFSQQELRRTTQDAILEAIEDQDPAAGALASLAARMEAPQRTWSVAAPIDGLLLEKLSLELGLTTFAMRDSDPIRGVVDMVSRLSDEKMTWRAVKKCWEGAKCFALTQVEAADGSQMAIAETYIEDALDYLRAYIDIERSSLDRDHSRPGLPGTVPSGTLALVTLDEDERRVATTVSHRGAMIPICIGPADVERMRDTWGYDGISRLLSLSLAEREDPSNDMVGRVTRAVRWLGRAGLTTDVGAKAVNYWTALETMLMQENEGPKGYLVARRTAWLLSEHWAPLGWEQAELKSWVKKHAYSIRNDVVHEGRLRLPSSTLREVQRLGQVALAVVGVIADNVEQWPSLSDLIGCVE